MPEPRPTNLCQPLALGSFRNWLRLLWANRGVDRKFFRRACFVSTASFLTIPFRLYERARYRGPRKGDRLEPPPIFVIGHWRTGTTALHQLLCKDPALGYISMFQSIAPECFLSGGRMIRGLVSRVVPPKRMMDNMSLSLDDPQEEEFAVAEMSPFSFYHHWSFPRKAREYFEKYALFRGVPASAVETWKKTYLSILHKAAWRAGGRRLVVKNPVNTARVRILLELFPDAKFIHIYRNPYIVFLSTRHFFHRVLALTRLQEIPFVPSASGENYNPHVTTGAGPQSYLDEMMAEPFEAFSFSPTGASVYQLGTFGTAQKKLTTLTLQP